MQDLGVEGDDHHEAVVRHEDEQRQDEREAGAAGDQFGELGCCRIRCWIVGCDMETLPFGC